jgi:hypothetical protein
VAESVAPASLNIGFLTVLQEPSGQLGGYLVTNSWGRPLEFRLSTAVQPNRVQQILYGKTLDSYICADLIGKTLWDKTSTPVQLIVTDREAVLDLRLRIDVPVVWLAGRNPVQEQEARPLPKEKEPLSCHPQFPHDRQSLQSILQRLSETIDMAEPFERIREAIGEARKMGVTSRN